jgi:hypothetical protein
MALSAYNFHIDSSVINNIYTLMMDGNNDTFIEDGHHMRGSERGGHFCYTKDNTNFTVKINSLIQAGLMPGTTSLNSGDFPFTFHTHPIVVNLDENIVDNYPNLISDDDLGGAIVDNFYCNFLDERNICDKTGNQNIGGINFFDIVAVPYGLFVYRPNPNYGHRNRTIEENDDECLDIFNQSMSLLPNYILANTNKYFIVTTQKAQLGIQQYIQLLQSNGFIIDFFPWEQAKQTGIHFVNILPINSYVDTECICNV